MTADTGWAPFDAAPEQGGVQVVEHANGKRYAFDGFRELEGFHLEGTDRAPGSVLIGWGAWLLAALGGGLLFVSFAGQFRYIFAARHQDVASLIESAMFDVGMIIFSLLALGLARAGKPARTERALILACSAGSAAMNYAAADTASARSVAAFVAAPVFLAVVVDRVIAVIRRVRLGDDEASAWSALGRVLLTASRLAGVTALYSLRFVLAPPSTATGLRRMVIAAAPLPGGAVPRPLLAPDVTAAPAATAPGTAVITIPEAPNPARPRGRRGESKTARFLALVTERHGPLSTIDPSSVSRIASALAPMVDLNVGSARSVLGELVRGAQNGHAHA
jgi:hypothetical protein